MKKVLRRSLSLFLMVVSVVLVGCGGKPSTQPSGGSGSNPLDPQGNWEFNMLCSGNCGSTAQFAGQLFELNPPTVTSKPMLAFSNGCGNFSLSVSGQASGTDSITFAVTELDTSRFHASANFQFQGTIAADQNSMSGTWTSTETGGCVGSNSGTWEASLIAPFTGNYTGTSNTGGFSVSLGVTENTDQTSAQMGQLRTA